VGPTAVLTFLEREKYLGLAGIRTHEQEAHSLVPIATELSWHRLCKLGDEHFKHKIHTFRENINLVFKI
jgi:hypothetical protein